MELIRDGGTLLLEGPVDVRSTARLRDAIYDQLSEQPETVLLDVTGVDWIDATTMRMLAVATRNAERQDSRLVIVGMSAHLRRTLRMSRLSHLLNLDGPAMPRPSAVPRQRGSGA